MYTYFCKAILIYNVKKICMCHEANFMSVFEFYDVQFFDVNRLN